MIKKSTKKLAIGTAIAAVGGYVAGILTAPKSGKETRKDIKDAANKAVTEAEKRLKVLHSELSDLLVKAKGQSAKISDQAKEKWQQAMDTAQSAKNKARDVLSAAHEGGADDKDLDTAIKEASNAIKHLKTFIKKDEPNKAG